MSDMSGKSGSMKVVVVGAGYAGTIAANRLARKASGAQITVVNPRDEFVERIRLHQTIAGTGGAVRPLNEMLHPSIAVVVDAVEEIGDGVVVLASGRSLDFDHLVYAVGCAEFAPAGTLAVAAPDQAAEAAARLVDLPQGATVTVVGGGLTGIETASEVAAVRPDLKVRLISEEFGESLGDNARAQVRKVLDGLGVQVVSGVWRPDEAVADLTLWAVASKANGLAARSGLAVDAAGRVEVDEYLRSTSDRRVFAVGDGAAAPGSRMSCQAALPQGAHAGTSLARIARGKEPKPFSMSFVGQNVSLGRRDAVIQIGRRDDSPTRFWYGGLAAAKSKETVCKATVWSARKGAALVFPGPKK